MKYVVTLNGKNYEVEVERGEATVLNITDAPTAVPASVISAPVAPPATAAPAAAPISPAAGESILSPMPGTILDIKVTAGQTVKRGQVLVVLEAMKMENDIVAPRDAVVAQVATTKGASVNTGDLLVVLS
ncbi:MAG: biotin/lipoyl-binding protein [Clostridiales bacterium]|nr:biotin/lipoyl-binding protein [Clostridiales bacterium]